MKNLKIISTPIKDLNIIKHNPKFDRRGFLNRIFCKKSLSILFKKKNINQINITKTKKKGTIRGLHFQYPPYAETKLVYCLKGKIWDVAVDLRKKSKTFLNYHSEILSENNFKSYLIPEGFAHGFQTLTANCEILYLHTCNHNKEFEGAINVIDPLISIKWPLMITQRSMRDLNHPILQDDFKGI